MDVAERYLLVAAISLALLCFALVYPAFAEHPAEHMQLHEKFYKTWMMPDNRNVSCCHDEDCAPAQTYRKDGRWYARKEGDTGDFTPVPPQKVEQDRDSPDGRSHICGRRYGFNGGELSVFCFIAGAGG
jgi:hypothetical protein